MPENEIGTQGANAGAGAGDGGAGAAGAGAGANAQGQQAAAGGDQNTQRPGAGTNNQPDPHREGMLRDLRTERAERQRLEKELKEFRESIDGRNRKMGEALGIVQPEDTEGIAAIRAQFAKVYPELHALVEAGIDPAALKELIANGSQIKQTADHYWVEKGQQVVDTIAAEISKEIGGELNDDQYDEIAHAYVRYVAKGGDAMRQRHEREPLKVAKEFAAKYAERWFAPARRKVSQAAGQRFGRAIPQGTRGAPVVQQKAKIDFNDEDAFKNALKDSFRAGVE